MSGRHLPARPSHNRRQSALNAETELRQYYMEAADRGLELSKETQSTLKLLDGSARQFLSCPSNAHDRFPAGIVDNALWRQLCIYL
jgi:hypothetical protein